jgi:hypothetical protein
MSQAMKNRDVRRRRVRMRSLNANDRIEAAQYSRTHKKPKKKKVEPWRRAHTATVDCKNRTARSITANYTN